MSVRQSVKKTLKLFVCLGSTTFESAEKLYLWTFFLVFFFTSLAMSSYHYLGDNPEYQGFLFSISDFFNLSKSEDDFLSRGGSHFIVGALIMLSGFCSIVLFFSSIVNLSPKIYATERERIRGSFFTTVSMLLVIALVGIAHSAFDVAHLNGDGIFLPIIFLSIFFGWFGILVTNFLLIVSGMVGLRKVNKSMFG